MRPSGAIVLSGACALALSGLSPEARGQAPQQRVLDREGINVAALRGTVVWESSRGGRAALVRRTGSRAKAIPGARAGAWSDDLLSPGTFYFLDVGIDARGRVIATYRLCGPKRCRGPFAADVLGGGVRRLHMRVPPRCEAVGIAAVWRRRIATTLRCSGRRHTGVYILQGRQARLVTRMADARALDLVGDTIAGYAAHRVWIASARRSRCRAVAATVPSYVNRERVQLTEGRLWWGVSTAADFGGSESEFGTATVGPGCAVAERRAITTFPELDWASGSFAVDGDTVYVAGRDTGGVVTAPAG